MWNLVSQYLHFNQKTEGNRRHERPSRGKEDNIKIGLKEKGS